MRFKTSSKLPVLIAVVSLLLSSLVLVANGFAQETTGGLQGTIKDPTGAVVAKASVVLTGNSLGGAKSLETDSSGYYRFANLPPGTYTLVVKVSGFSELKREGIAIEVGHLPSLDLTLAVGAAGTVVEVSGEAPVIDVTTNTNQTNITQDVINDIPHGYSFQSVIQFSPMARNEPLMGGSAGITGNAGGSLPGSNGNGQSVGFSVGGGSDSENQYLVEGQDTENISGGASGANVPFQFIQEVQVKSSGIEAEHGGALGGVVNVIMKKGQNAYHGSFFATYEGDSLNGSQNATLRYDPLGAPFSPSGAPAGSPGFDDDAQTYQPTRDHYRIAQVGFTVGGPIIKDRLFFFLGFAPQYNSLGRVVDFTNTLNPSNVGLGLGSQHFTQDQQTYFSTARLDAVLTQKIRVFGSWLYQYQRENGDSLPGADPVASLAGNPNYLNEFINSPITQYSHGLGFSNPNATYNVGADITLTPKIVATTRYGYFFNNYHDIGWPTTGVDVSFQTNGVGVDANCTPQPCTPSTPLPANLALPAGTTTAPFDQSYTEVNASKHYQFNQDVAFFKSGWLGTHNIKAGYQFNKLSNVINQHGNLPFINMSEGAGNSFRPGTAFGGANCATLTAEWGVCGGQYGYINVSDFATVLKNADGVPVPATDHNHALFVQDAWTVGHGLTLNLGIRIEKETLPAPPGIGIASIKTINFSWADKIAPRLGAAWGSRNGKVKIFGSYGVTNDVMKLLLAQTSFGAQGFDNCGYALGPDSSGGYSNSDLDLTFVNGRACPTGVSTVGANFIGGATPASLMDAGTGVSLIENTNLRPEEPIAPGLKPYRQHETVAGWDYQINKDWAFEARYDRRRLDHVIEDASLSDPDAFEIYNVVNPGQGVNKTLNGYASYLTSLGDVYGPGTAAFNPTGAFGTCTGCPNNPQAIRDYDGLELRLTKTQSRGFSGMFSYTWSRLWGNYAGLTTTDQTDSIGRNSPDTSRSFDEPFYYFEANGKSNAGPLPTDRPSAFKGYAYYTMPWKGGFRNNTTTLGLFQVAYQGSPVSSYSDLGLGVSAGAGTPAPVESTYLYGRGNWISVTQDAVGNITLGTPSARRTPWYTQTDFNLQHSVKVNHNNESQVLSFNANFTNLLNQHSVTEYWAGFDSSYLGTALFPYEVAVAGIDGAQFYQKVETGYNPQAEINSQAAGTCSACVLFNGGTSPGIPLPVVKSSLYGQPNLWQISRHIRLGATFTW